jgi:serine/threonine protein kinase
MNDVFSQYTLPVGTMVQEYKIIEILGIGNFGIVYSAENKYFSEIVALKEFLPSDLAHRSEGDSRVHSLSSETEKAFTWARHKFLQEAKTLRELGHPSPHPNIVRVRQFIEANATAYMVMDFEKGEPLSKMLDERGTLDEAAIMDILDALLDGIERVHGASVWHRDIKPSNILIRSDGSPVLIDFGAARKDISGSDRSTMAIFSPAYAAPEQIFPVGDQGPWTDIYSLGATLYRAVSGKLPTNAAKRVQGEAYVPVAEVLQGRFAPSLLAAIDAALQLYPKDRPQSIAEWKGMLAQAAEPANDKTVWRPLPQPPTPEKKPFRPNYRPYAMVAAVVAIVAASALIYRLVFPPAPIDTHVEIPADSNETETTARAIDEPGSVNATEERQAAPIIPVPVPVRAHVTIDSIPTAAHVFIDDKFKGITPMDTTVDKGSHALRLRLDDHYDWESTLLVEEDVEIPIRIPLLNK